SIYTAVLNWLNTPCGAACWKINLLGMNKMWHSRAGKVQMFMWRGSPVGRAPLCLFILVKVGAIVVVVCEKFVAVEANILANIDTHQKIITRHIRRENQVFIDLFNELRQVSFVKFSLQNECTMNCRRGEMDIYCTQAIVTLQAIPLHDVIALRGGSSEVSFKPDIIHRISVCTLVI